MRASRFLVPDIPADTVQAGQAVICEDSPFRVLAGAMGELAAHCNAGAPADTFPFLKRSLMTLFQFMDALTDVQATKAMRTRVDWKYALHLPLSHPGIRPAALCLFRQRIKSDPAAMQMFQAIAIDVKRLRLWPHMDKEFSYVELPLKGLCALNQIDWKTEAMAQAIESLATFSPEWLRRIARPHWYFRYVAGVVATPKCLQNEALFALTETTDVDVAYLVKMLEQEDAADLTRLAEIRQLKRIWQQLGGSSPVRSDHWANCAHCVVGACIADDCYQYGCSIRH